MRIVDGGVGDGAAVGAGVDVAEVVGTGGSGFEVGGEEGLRETLLDGSSEKGVLFGGLNCIQDRLVLTPSET